jgi:hypothetical protein
MATPLRAARRHVDVVVTHRHRADHPQLRAGCIEHCGVDAVGDQAVDAFDARRQLQELSARERRIVVPVAHRAICLDAVECCSYDTARDEHQRFVHCVHPAEVRRRGRRVVDSISV